VVFQRFFPLGYQAEGAQMDLVLQYLERAHAAEARAATAKDESLKTQWREIANEYRNLAQVRLTLTKGPASSDNPSILPDVPASSRK
jgi:predicted mannosyl-3-phosphoglycerate phosphatase (HAD superfamily)